MKYSFTTSENHDYKVEDNVSKFVTAVMNGTIRVIRVDADAGDQPFNSDTTASLASLAEHFQPKMKDTLRKYPLIIIYNVSWVGIGNGDKVKEYATKLFSALEKYGYYVHTALIGAGIYAADDNNVLSVKHLNDHARAFAKKSKLNMATYRATMAGLEGKNKRQDDDDGDEEEYDPRAKRKMRSVDEDEDGDNYQTEGSMYRHKYGYDIELLPSLDELQELYTQKYYPSQPEPPENDPFFKQALDLDATDISISEKDYDEPKYSSESPFNLEVKNTTTINVANALENVLRVKYESYEESSDYELDFRYRVLGIKGNKFELEIIGVKNSDHPPETSEVVLQERLGTYDIRDRYIIGKKLRQLHDHGVMIKYYDEGQHPVLAHSKLVSVKLEGVVQPFTRNFLNMATRNLERTEFLPIDIRHEVKLNFNSKTNGIIEYCEDRLQTIMVGGESYVKVTDVNIMADNKFHMSLTVNEQRYIQYSSIMNEVHDYWTKYGLRVSDDKVMFLANVDVKVKYE